MSEQKSAEHIAAATSAAFLHSVAGLRPVALGVAFMSAAAVWLGGMGIAASLFVASLLTSLPVLYLSFRVRFDAQLFDVLACDKEPVAQLSALDSALVSLGLIAKASPRSLVGRVLGARRLARRALIAHGIQLVLFFAALAASKFYGN